MPGRALGDGSRGRRRRPAGSSACAPGGSPRGRGRRAQSTTICRSNRPGRSSAGSSTSGRLVAAIRMTPSFDSKPSISTSSWLSVCSRSSCPPPRPAPRCRPTASISSMKMMQGACALPCSKRSRTRLAPTPTNISTKSEPDIEKNGRARLAGHRLGEQRLAGARGPDQQRALGQAAAQPGELLRVLEELDDLLQLDLGLVGSRPRRQR